MNEALLVSLGLVHLKALALVVPLLAILYGVRQFSAQERYLAVRIAFGILAAIPLLAWLAPEFRVPIHDWPLSPSTSISVTTMTLSAAGMQPTYTSVRFSLAEALAIGYALVAVALLLRLMAQFHVTRRELARHRLVKDPELIGLLDELRATLGIRPAVELRISNDAADVYAWGIARHAIVLPQRFASLPEQVRRTVLIHELIHVRRRDTATCLLVQMLCCLYWLNPAVWLLNRRLKLEMERSCDDLALSSGIGATDYADRLLQMAAFSVASRSTPSHVVTMARTTTLHQRIDSLLNETLRRGVMNKPKLIALTSLLAAVGLGICICSIGRAAAPASTEYVDVQLVLPDDGTGPSESTQRKFREAMTRAFGNAGFTERKFEIRRIAHTPAGIEISGGATATGHVATLMKAIDANFGDADLEILQMTGLGCEFKLQVANLRYPATAPAASSRPQ